jgi:hypothetical protein
VSRRRLNSTTPKPTIGDPAREQKLGVLLTGLFRPSLALAQRGLVRLLRLRWRRRPVRREHAQKEEQLLPCGPFALTRPQQAGDLLLWVPRRLDSFLIDDLTGGYGYSHTSVDTGEIDLPTRRPVMVEVTVGQQVARKFLDEYPQRPFVRLLLRQAGVDVAGFLACVQSKLGNAYDGLEALTLGEIDDPAKEVCSGLAAACLPEPERQRIARARRLGLLRRRSVSVYSKAAALETREFISPNGFAEYYGAPPGRRLGGPDISVHPRPLALSPRRAATAAAQHHGWKLVLALAVLAGSLLSMGYFSRRFAG